MYFSEFLLDWKWFHKNFSGVGGSHGSGDADPSLLGYGAMCTGL